MSCASCGCRDFEVCVTQGDGYLIADGRGICISSAGCSWPSGLTNPKLILENRSGGCGCPWPGDPVICGVITGSNGRYSACFQMTSEQSHALAIGKFQYNLRLVAETLHGAVVTLRHGKLTVQ